MQITHEEAHRLIQLKLDNRMNSKNEEALNAHLKDCVDCLGYSDEIKDAVNTLRRTMNKQWNLHPLPLQMESIRGKINSKGSASILLTTRTALVGIAFVMFAYVAWQSVITNNAAPQQTPLGALPLIPTPSTQFTATTTRTEVCDEIRYIVKEDDTLESIAHQFSISKEDIMSANNMTEESIHPAAELFILLCKSTPTSTIYPPTFTITPYFEKITTTPG